MANSASSADQRNLGDGERIASVLGGTALLLYGLARRPSLSSALLAAAGGLLLQRGLAGHCPLYRALGLSTLGAQDDPSVIDEIEQAAHDSFPASDPPSWSPHTAGGPAAHH
jgi:uncharacterized membrane protein